MPLAAVTMLAEEVDVSMSKDAAEENFEGEDAVEEDQTRRKRIR